MIEEKVQVVAVQGQFAWVESNGKSVCDGCSVSRGCGAAVLAKLFGNKRAQFQVSNSIAAQVGDQVVIGIEEQALVLSAFMVYALPLLSLLAFALVGISLAHSLGLENGDGLSIIFGLAGLVGGLLWARRYGARRVNKARYQPNILRYI